jgi:DGQHR domain-containing protein
MPKDRSDSEIEESEEPSAKEAQAESPFDFEERFRRLLFDMGLSDIIGGKTFVLGGYQIDAAGGIDDHLFLFDCTIRRGGRSATKQLRPKILQWRGKYNAVLDAVHADRTLAPYKHLVLVIAANAEVTDADTKLGLNEEPTVHILSRSQIEYLSEITDDIGRYAKFRFANLLGVFIQRNTESVPAIRVVSAGRPIYLFAAPARDLAELAFVPQAEAGFEFFYQRLIKKGKIKAIAEYVVARPRPFPNSVVLASNADLDFTPLEQQPSSNQGLDTVTIGHLRLPSRYGEFWVVDGQHRIYGSALSSEPPVLACTLIPATDLEKARYFLDINSEQTKIDSDLKWDLRAQLVKSQPEGKISAACQELDDLLGPLHDRVRIPHKGGRKSRDIKLSGLCDAILRNRVHETHQYNWRDDEFVRLLSRDLNTWFSLIDSEVPESDVKSKFLLENSGLSVLIILFKRIAQLLDHERPSLQRLTPYAKQLGEWVRELEPRDSASLAKRASSEGGRSQVADVIVAALNEKLPANLHLSFSGHVTRLIDDIGQFEGELRSRLATLFEQKIGADWISRSGLGKAGREPTSPDSLTLGQIRSVLSQEQFWHCVDPGFREREVKRELALHLFDYVKDYRNAMDHGRLEDVRRFDSATAAAGLRTLRLGFGI